MGNKALDISVVHYINTLGIQQDQHHFLIRYLSCSFQPVTLACLLHQHNSIQCWQQQG